ncbi:MAG: cell surface protein SprA, partial [Flavobacteriales bacterium]|nr:cell surface protein SprA [Flavobacteriales bacterium]
GHHKSLGNSGVSYIDDFEASKTGIDMKNMGAWFLSSIPQGQENIFPNSELNNDLISGFQRAKVAWYTIDPLFYRSTSITPPGVNKVITLPNGNTIAQQSYHYSREVLEKEVFPNKDPDLGSQISNLALLDVAYYPNKRGPYNYNVSELNDDGTLQNPSNKWAGLMRKVETNDFEAANIEFIEFWMMDPFDLEDGDINHSGGDLYFQLGNVSEDILKDGYKSFENGLPISSTIENVDTTVWGRVPTSFSIVNAFDNDPNSRDYQDVGFDGLRTTDEKLFFDSYLQEIANAPNLGTASIAYQNAENDPSGDNYHYYRGSDFDNNQTNVLDRYLNFNNMDGNSVTTDQSPESYPTSSTTIPNTEDINKDNTLSESESYFQYKVHLFPNMGVGDSYISDVFTANVKTENGNTRSVKWYQFRVPVYKPDKTVGGIQDFKSIRFMRMVFADFQQPIVCRFATLDLVRGEWRRYNFDLSSPGEYLPIDDQDNTLFDVTAVNVEENGKRSPINYVIPPGIEQEVDNTTTTLRRQNEQSLVLKVCDLKDGDSRAAYKTSDLDVRSYKRIKMFVHAEGKNDDLKDGDFSCFIRLGTDFVSNYYEYEVSLKATPHGASSANAIWPSSNQIDIAFEEFQKAKQKRNDAIRNGTHSNVSDPFIKHLSSGKKIQIVGNPNLARVKTIMIGIRNPKKLNIQSADDGFSKCGEIWVNELRLTDFDEYGGWAANTRLTTRLADFGTVTFAGSMSTIGFGSIEKKINERQRVNIYQYDMSSTFELGKFFPEDYGVKIPMYMGISEVIQNPQYNPLDPDILFKTTLETLDTKQEKDELKHIAQDYVKRKSINFTNVRKVQAFNKKKSKNAKAKKAKVYDIENVSLSYSFNETFIRNINTEFNKTKLYRGAITYNYHTTPKNIKPFAKANLGKSKYVRLIKDFNFNTMPKSFSFRTDLERHYNETKLRNINNSNMLIFPTYNKFFNWNRMYEVKYDLTRTLKVDLVVNNKAVIDEPAGGLSKTDLNYKEKRDTIWQNFWEFGRATNYHQNINVNYQVPLNKIPFLDFMSLNTRYSGSYDWTAAPKSLQYLGNNIQNSNTRQYNGQINMNTLYNKVPYFKKVNQSANNRRGRNQRGRNNEQNQEQEDDKKNRYEVFKHMTRFLLSVKNISVNYSENRGTFLPGFMPKPHFMGQQWSMMAPGLPFVFGSQNDIRYRAASEGWLTTNASLNTLFKTNYSSNLTLRSTVEPIKQFRIELTANKTKSLNKQEYWRADSLGSFRSFSPIETGGFSVSIISWSTAFLKDDEQYSSKTFAKFRNYRNDIARRLAAENPDFNGGIDPVTGFPIEFGNVAIGEDSIIGGYGPTSQDVMIPAFLAAYTGKDAIGVSLNKFPKIPLPNWRITYNGLTKVKFIKRYFETFTLGHAYRSTYSVSSFSSNLDYKDENGDVQMNLNNMSYHSKYDISQVSINEQFSPLFKLDMTWKNSLLTRFEIKKSRMLSLSLSNNQLTEIASNEYVIGTGYRIKDVSFNFLSGGRGKKISSDLDLKLDLNIRNNRTVIRKVVEDEEQITAGQQIITIKFSTDYVINDRLNIKAFYDKVITNPFLSTTFPGAITNAGFSIRFTLAG